MVPEERADASRGHSLESANGVSDNAVAMSCVDYSQSNNNYSSLLTNNYYFFLSGAERAARRRGEAPPAAVFLLEVIGVGGGGKVENLILVFHFPIRPRSRSCGNVGISPAVGEISRGLWSEAKLTLAFHAFHNAFGSPPALLDFIAARLFFARRAWFSACWFFLACSTR